MVRSVGDMSPGELRELIFSVLSEAMAKVADSIVVALEELLNPDTIELINKSRKDIEEGRFRRVSIEEIDELLE